MGRVDIHASACAQLGRRRGAKAGWTSAARISSSSRGAVIKSRRRPQGGGGESQTAMLTGEAGEGGAKLPTRGSNLESVREILMRVSHPQYLRTPCNRSGELEACLPIKAPA